MDFSPSEDHEEIAAAVRRICADFPDAYWRDKDEAHEFPWEFYKAFAAGGWLGIAMPEEYGGGGGGGAGAAPPLGGGGGAGGGPGGGGAPPPPHLRAQPRGESGRDAREAADPA